MSSLPPLPTVKEYNPTSDDIAEAEQLISKAAEVSEFWAEKYEKDAVKNWDLFYKRNRTNFFKDRHYLVTEFGEVARSDSFIDANEATGLLVEVGCGVGNAVIPLAQACPKISILATDCSSIAIDLLNERLEAEDPSVARRISTRVLDATSTHFPPEDLLGSADFVLLLFCLSAISEAHYSSIVEGVRKILRPGGIVLFRDYGKYDLAQLRFSKDKGRAATASRLPGEDDFYVRQDGTRAKFFTEDSLVELWERQGGFQRVELFTHRRCVINRKQGKEMKRVWIQAKWRAPLADGSKVSR
ncbi:Actin-binding protein ABP140, putative [Perkinsus marinus ATCC 50983]|uniref:tRNA N(3)-methylcytidine methyltransferase n=1 Tax=Perkinsus marinus (strain ATCC 50983 / TXsc) TaxID=423536 RepID=C5LKW5_PERM5|nr:Actin-binding protein ABP140, putative [Perkinsus marinus ATCC 50983]EER02627.1 Actin-binding protein ABP140, putative [Perkinsus marinus ATCC 50983]|eukprot:XP_002769909.1 Actin-binding protein ABP140, putative [Perkinsus marinus ATCC 50983]